MGLFDKKYCDFCGNKIGLLGNRNGFPVRVPYFISYRFVYGIAPDPQKHQRHGKGEGTGTAKKPT